MENKTPRMRTISEAVDLLKETDPCSAMSYNAITNLCKTNQIKYIKIGRKFLINYDYLLSFLGKALD